MGIDIASIDRKAAQTAAEHSALPEIRDLPFYLHLENMGAKWSKSFFSLEFHKFDFSKFYFISLEFLFFNQTLIGEDGYKSHALRALLEKGFTLGTIRKVISRFCEKVEIKSSWLFNNRSYPRCNEALGMTYRLNGNFHVFSDDHFFIC